MASLFLPTLYVISETISAVDWNEKLTTRVRRNKKVYFTETWIGDFAVKYKKPLLLHTYNLYRCPNLVEAVSSILSVSKNTNNTKDCRHSTLHTYAYTLHSIHYHTRVMVFQWVLFAKHDKWKKQFGPIITSYK